MRSIVALVLLAMFTLPADAQTRPKKARPPKPKKLTPEEQSLAKKKQENEAARFVTDRPLKVGDVGNFWRRHVKVVQVIDKDNALVSMDWEEYRGTAGTGQVWETYWLKWPTAGMADGQRADVPKDKLFKVTGTTTYKTAAGPQRTVLVIEQAQEEGAKDSGGSK